MSGALPGADDRQRLVRLLAILVILLGVGLALRVAPYQVDDAAITYRYAVNVAHGHGFVFDIGRAPVEGFSSPAWLALLSVAALISREALPFVATGVGLVCLVGVAIIALRSTKPDANREDAFAGVVAAALWSIAPSSGFHAVAGLETLLFAVVVVIVARAIALDRVRGPTLLVAFLAAWVRPEAPWLVVAIAAQLAIEGRWREMFARSTLRLVGALGAGTLVLLAMRWFVFHAWLPNTYYAKQAGLAVGVPYVLRSFATPSGIGLVALAIAGAALGTRAHRGYFAAGVAWAFAAALEGGDWMPGARMLVPSIALLALAAGGIGCLSRRSPARRRRAIAAALGVFVVIAAMGFESNRLATIAARSDDGVRHENAVLASWLQRSGARSVALVDIGLVGFMTPVEIVDLGGLTDARIAHSPGSLLEKQFDLAYLFDERRPEYIVVRSDVLPARDANGRLAPRPRDANSAVEQRILADARVRRDYVPLFALIPASPRMPLYARTILVRRDVRPADAALLPQDTLAVSPRSE